jgi:hypothetical protein
LIALLIIAVFLTESTFLGYAASPTPSTSEAAAAAALATDAVKSNSDCDALCDATVLNYAPNGQPMVNLDDMSIKCDDAGQIGTYCIARATSRQGLFWESAIVLPTTAAAVLCTLACINPSYVESCVLAGSVELATDVASTIAMKWPDLGNKGKGADTAFAWLTVGAALGGAGAKGLSRISNMGPAAQAGMMITATTDQVVNVVEPNTEEGDEEGGGEEDHETTEQDTLKADAHIEKSTAYAQGTAGGVGLGAFAFSKTFFKIQRNRLRARHSPQGVPEERIAKTKERQKRVEACGAMVFFSSLALLRLVNLGVTGKIFSDLCKAIESLAPTDTTTYDPCPAPSPAITKNFWFTVDSLLTALAAESLGSKLPTKNTHY